MKTDEEIARDIAEAAVPCLNPGIIDEAGYMQDIRDRIVEAATGALSAVRAEQREKDARIAEEFNFGPVLDGRDVSLSFRTGQTSAALRIAAAILAGEKE